MGQKVKILLTGGGTGGHIQPLVAVVNELNKLAKKRHLDMEYLHVGTGNEMEKKLMATCGVKTVAIRAGKFRRYFSLKNIIDSFNTPIGILQSFMIIRKFKPDIIFGKGGYVSVPAVIAGNTSRIPVVTHDSDLTPGLANKILARYAKTICISFEESRKYFPKRHVVVTGNPINLSILEGNHDHAYKTFKLSSQKPVIFVTGGSSGARRLNEVLLEIIKPLLDKYQVIHQCGVINMDEVKDATLAKFGDVETHEVGEGFHALDKQYCVYPFLTEGMKDAYAVADLVIARAGAANLAEIAALGKPAILIPLPKITSRGEQVSNANAYKKAGAAVVLEQERLTGKKLLYEINAVFKDKDKMSSMSQKVKAFAKIDAAEKVAEEILKLAK